MLRNAQQLSVTNGFFLGGAQIIFEAQKAHDTVLGVSILSNVWYDCDGPSLAVNETLGAWTSVTDFDATGTAFCGYSRTKATGLAAATKVYTLPADNTPSAAFDFSDVLLFPSAGIASASVNFMSACNAHVLTVPGAGAPLQVSVDIAACAPGSAALKGQQLIVSVDQSERSTWSVQA